MWKGPILAVLTESGAGLAETSLRGASLIGVDLSRAYLHQTGFEGTDLTGANLSDAILEQASFTNANLENANLTGAKEAYVNDAILCNTTMPDGSIRTCYC